MPAKTRKHGELYRCAIRVGRVTAFSREWNRDGADDGRLQTGRI